MKGLYTPHTEYSSKEMFCSKISHSFWFMNIKEKVWFREIFPYFILLIYLFFFFCQFPPPPNYFIEHALGNASLDSDIQVDYFHVAFSAY